MELKLTRKTFTSGETLGSLSIDGKFFCYTLEDVVRDRKIFADTCIPYGKYTVEVTLSSRFGKRLPLVYNKPNLSVTSENGDVWNGIRMHGGNTQLDTEGCILVAKTEHLNENSGILDKAKHMIKNWIQGSMADQLTKLLDNGQKHTLEITKA
jgi:hypothetical protein